MVRCLLFVFSSLFWCVCAQAQPPQRYLLSAGQISAAKQRTHRNIGRLNQQYAAARTDSSRCRILTAMARQYAEVDPDSCFYWLNEALLIARRSQHGPTLARVMHGLGYACLYLAKDEAKAARWFRGAVAAAAKSGDDACMAESYGLLSIIALHQNTGNADDLLTRMLSHAQKANTPHVLMLSYSILADHRLQKEQYGPAEQALKQAMAAGRLVDLDGWFTIGLDYADVLAKTGRTQQAQAFCRQLARLKHRLPAQTGFFIYANDIARLDIMQNELAEAKTLLLSAVEMENGKAKPDTVHLFFCYRNLTDLYVKQGDYKSAYLAGNQLATLRLYLNQKRQTRDSRVQMIQLRSALELQKKEQEVAELAAHQRQQRLYLAGAIAVAGMLLGFAFVLHHSKQRIEQQKSELTTLNNLKDQLFAIISHDLRGPVVQLKQGFDRLLRTNAPPAPEQLLRFAQSVNVLSDLTDNLLFWALAQQRGLRTRPQPHPLAEPVEDALRLYGDVILQKRLDVVSTVADEEIWADEQQAQIVVRNIIQNAIKFSPVGGQLRLSSEQGIAHTTLAVQDDGPGFDWTPDVPSPAVATGTGLGLRVARLLMNLNRGTLQIGRRGETGTVVRLSWPSGEATDVTNAPRRSSALREWA